MKPTHSLFAWRHLGLRPLPLLTPLFAASLLAACHSQASPSADAPPPPQVSVATVLSDTVSPWDDYTGRIVAVETVALRPRVSGYVEQVAFAEGQHIRQGDLLFIIDPRPYRAALEHAQADLAKARSEAQLANAHHVRAATLFEAKVISREEFETRNAANAQAKAMVRAAEAAVTQAALNLQFTEVRSPINGRAGRALVTTGNLAQADATILTTVVSQDPVHVHFDVDESRWLRYARDTQDGEVAAAHRPVRVGLAEDKGYPLAGKIDFIDNQIEQATGTIRARAVLPNPDGRLTPGLFARVQLQGGSERQALLVNEQAILTDQDRKYVYVLAEGNTAQRRDITPGPVIDGLRIVEQGLTPGDRVIVNGLQKVYMPGMPVTPETVAMRATPVDAAQ